MPLELVRPGHARPDRRRRPSGADLLLSVARQRQPGAEGGRVGVALPLPLARLPDRRDAARLPVREAPLSSTSSSSTSPRSSSPRTGSTTTSRSGGRSPAPPSLALPVVLRRRVASPGSGSLFYAVHMGLGVVGWFVITILILRSRGRGLGRQFSALLATVDDDRRRSATSFSSRSRRSAATGPSSSSPSSASSTSSSRCCSASG